MGHYYDYAQEWDSRSIMLIIAMLGEASRQDIINEWKKHGRNLKRSHLDKVLRFLLGFGVVDEAGENNHYRLQSRYLRNAILNKEPESLLDDLLANAGGTGGTDHA